MREPRIHPSAIVDPAADLDSDVEVGPYSVIGPGVRIHPGTQIGPRVTIERNTEIGPGCRVFSGAVLGTDPQDLKYRGEETSVSIGADTIIREFVTIHRGTVTTRQTRVGQACFLMAYVHVAHDCQIGDHVVLANSVHMGGHVRIDDYAVVGGIVPIHQFVRIGEHAIVGGGFRVVQDVPPYILAAGYPLRLHGLNSVGLMRRGFSAEVRAQLKRAYRLLFTSGFPLQEACGRVAEELGHSVEVMKLVNFIRESKRGIIRE